MKLSKQLADKARELAQEKEEAEAQLRKLDELLEMMRSLGISTATLSELIAKSRSDFEAKLFKSCIANASRAVELCNKLIMELFEQRLEATDRLIKLRSNYGMDSSKFSEASEAIRKLLSQSGFKEAEARLSSLWHEIEKSLSELFSQRYSKFQQELNEARSAVDTTLIEQILSASKTEIEKGNFESSLAQLLRAEGELKTLTASKIEELTSQIAERIETARRLGLDTEQFEKTLSSLGKESSYTPWHIVMHLSSLKSEIERRLKRAFEMELKTLQSDLRHESFSPAFVSASLAKLHESERLLEQYAFDELYSKLRSIEGEIEEAKYAYIARILLPGKKYLEDAIKNGLDVSPVYAKLNEVKELMKRKRYSDAIRAAHAANEEAKKIVQSVQEAEALASRIEEEYSKLNSVMNSVELSIWYGEVKKLYSSKRLGDFVSKAKRLLQEIEHSMDNFARGQSDSLERKISAVEYLGGDSLELNAAMDEIIRLIKSSEFLPAIQLSRETDEKCEAMLLELEQQWKKKAEEAVTATKEPLKSRLVQMLSSVSDLESKGEIYRAACTAKDAFEWASKGDAYRVNSLLERAHRLISITAGPGSNAASLIIEQAEKILPSDTERALVLAGQAHDMLFDLINKYFTDQMNMLLDIVSACRKKKIEIGYGYTLVSRARAAIRFEDFETARTMIELARSDIEGKLRRVNQLEAEYARAMKMMGTMKQRKMDTSAIESMLSDASAALSRFDYPMLSALVSRAIELEERALAPYVAPAEVVKFKALLEICQSAGVSQKHVSSAKETVNGLMRERKYYEALVQCSQLSSTFRQEAVKLLEKKIKELSDECFRLQHEDVDTGEAEIQLQKANQFLSNEELENANRAVNLAAEELTRARASTKEAKGKIAEAGEFTGLLDELNIADRQHFRLLREARSLYSEGKYLLSLQAATKCVEACNAALLEKSSSKLHEIERELSSIDEASATNLRRKMNEVASLLPKGGVEAARALLDLRISIDMIALQRDASARTLDVVRSKREELRQEGISSPELDAVIEEMEQLLKSGANKSVIEKGLEAQQLVEEARTRYRKISSMLEELSMLLNDYETAGIQVAEFTRSLQELEAMRSANYQELAERITSIKEKLKKHVYEGAISTLATLEKNAEVAKKLELRAPDVERYRELIVSGDIVGAYSSASSELSSLSSMLSAALQERLVSLLSRDWIPVNIAEKYSSRLSEMIMSGNYADALDFLLLSEKELLSSEETVRKIQELSSSMLEMIAPMKSAGIPVRALELKCREFGSSIEKSSLEALQRLMRDVERMRISFSPRIDVSLRQSQWGPMIEISNAGKVVATGLRAAVTSVDHRAEQEIGDLKSGESRSMGIPKSIRNEGTVIINGMNPVTGKEITVTRYLMLSGQELSASAKCNYCRGKMKQQPFTSCICGRSYHAPCAERVKQCECGERLLIS